MAFGEAKVENGFDIVPLVDDFVIETMKAKDTKGYVEYMGDYPAR